MKVIPPNEPIPFAADQFVEMPGSPGHHYFTDVLLTVVRQRHCDVHIGTCPVAIIRELSSRLEANGFDAYVRMLNQREGEFWLRRRPEWPK
jgi:hypothetical protein